MKKRVTALLVSLLLALLFVTSAYADTYSACGMVIRPPQKMSLYSKSSKSITYARTTGKVIDVLNYSKNLLMLKYRVCRAVCAEPASRM